MKKCKLPKNWIVVNSKSHPDRIYYFNVKTKQSMWKEPMLEQASDKSLEHVRKRRKNYDEGEERSRAKTPEGDSAGDKILDQQQSLSNKWHFQITEKTVEDKRSNQTKGNLAQDRMQKIKKLLSHKMQNYKEDNCSVIAKKPSERLHKYRSVLCLEENDTPQMKALREKILQRKLEKPAVRSKPSIKNQEHSLNPLLSKKSSEPTENNKTTVLSSKRSHSELTEDNDTSSSSRNTSSMLSGYSKAMTSLGKNDNRTILTPQMRVLYEKIQKNASTFDTNKKAKGDSKGKQELKIMKQTLVETPGEQEKNMPNRRSDWNKHDVKQKRNSQTIKNVAQDRMQKLRKSLSQEMQNHTDDCVTEVPSEILNKTFPFSYDGGNIASMSIHKNAEVRLKRLHNRVLKETVYGRNSTLSNNELQRQQNNEPDIGIATKNKLMKETNREVLYEEMDWEPMKDEEIALEIEVVRAQLNDKNCVNVLSNCPLENTVLTHPSESKEKGPLYIVIDTNVFLSNLEIIEQARDTAFKNYPRPFIVVPWTVIRELDYLKDDKSRSEALRTKARKAISFINDHFASKHPRIVGQTREQAATSKENFCLDCPDDEILQCCLQIRNLKKDVVLLSYDKNLCTKAMIHCITTLGRNDPLEKLDDFDTYDKIMNPLSNNIQHSIVSEELTYADELFEDAKVVMKGLASTIIVKQMEEIYGSEWATYVIIKPPWTVVTALKCIVKHWIAAINGSFQRHVEPTARELLEIFERLPVGGRKLQDVECILEKCSDLIQGINTDKHYELMVQSFNAITELKKKCLKYIAELDRKKLHDKIGIVEDARIQEQKTEKTLQSFKQIYSYARDLCGTMANIAGKVFPLNYNPINPPLSQATVKRLQPDISKKVTNLSHNLNKYVIL
ncbi:PREDICTED: transcriptional protein SWT1 isoform X2 [Dinoponera quadriceps]|uniref:Transcriptional protein SWT1 isoform X2 n=1 Tax=Dinoponera quadriceps TaxID=609295 RepID=A0A6P3Y402_DINQU|nr:PREDICTED: transcriptional protein SWT1 isoform X2 [Dinoponera quadriceps]